MIPATVPGTAVKAEDWGQDTVNLPATVTANVTFKLAGRSYFVTERRDGRFFMGWDVRPETITFLAVDDRFLTDAERLAMAVLTGDSDAAGPLADEVLERWNGARAESLRTAE